MARKTDKNKLKAIKKATIEVVVLEGISSASVSKIANKANVSVGYLYRFYKGKRELLEALFEERFQMINRLLQEQLKTQSTVKGMMIVFINAIYEVAKKEPQTISFTHRLLSDFSFELSDQIKEDITEICSKVLQIGKKTGEIDASINDETLYAIIVGGVLNFINIRLRNIFEEREFDQENIDNTIALLLKTLSVNS